MLTARAPLHHTAQYRAAITLHDSELKLWRFPGTRPASTALCEIESSGIATGYRLQVERNRSLLKTASSTVLLFMFPMPACPLTIGAVTRWLEKEPRQQHL